MSRESVAQHVSRETMVLLDAYAENLAKWTSKINLISRHTVSDIWSRHIQDSIQLWSYKPKACHSWTDIGSGGGLPAIPLACIAKDEMPDLRFDLIESDQRKAAFLRDFSIRNGLNVFVHAKRIEKVEPLAASIMTARALAPLDDLFDYCARHLADDGIALLPKGTQVEAELCQALERWHFSVQRIKSTTDNAAVILRIKDLKRAEPDD